MIKSISFRKEFIPLIKSGKKTVTRRIKTDLKKGDICWFKGGRTGKKEGYIKIKYIGSEFLNDITAFYSNEIEELELEGIKNIEAYIELWDKLNKKGYRWKDNPIIYRIRFEYIGEKL